MNFSDYITNNSMAGRALADRYLNDVREIVDRWQDEASEAALASNPKRAGYIEYMIGRL